MEPIRLDKRLSALLGIPRGEARRYIEGGWVSVNGEVVEQPQRPVDDSAVIVVAEQASDEKAERVSMLLHKPAGVAAETLCALVSSDSRSELDASDIRPLQRHFHGLQLAASLPASDSGLVVVSQDPATLAHLQRNLGRTEQEYLIEVAEGGPERGPWLMARLQQESGGAKVSWQSEQRLRFAGKGLTAKGL
ncbi:RNA-binding protein, partial [Stenotrophomonas maltophilia]